MGYVKIEDVKEKVIELYKKGKLKKEIMEELNISEHSIAKFFKNNLIYRFNEDCFENIDTEEKAYWLGFLWADGNISKHAIFLELQGSDVDHLIKFRNFLGNNYQEFDKTKGNCIRLRANSKKIIEDLIKLGFGLKDDRVVIPELSPELLNHFIRGYFDGDGHIRVKDNRFEGCDISGRIMFIDNLNKHVNFEREELHSTNSKRIYAHKKTALDFINKLYINSTVYLDRKYSCALLYRNV